MSGTGFVHDGAAVAHELDAETIAMSTRRERLSGRQRVWDGFWNNTTIYQPRQDILCPDSIGIGDDWRAQHIQRASSARAL